MILLESYRTMIEFYRDMVYYLQTLKYAESACDSVVHAMKKFSYGKTSFVSEVDEFQKMLAAADTLDEIVTGFESAITQAEEALGRAEGIDSKVIFMRDVEKKRLYEIADELGYSEGYIKNVSSRNPKKKCDFYVTDKLKTMCYNNTIDKYH